SEPKGPKPLPVDAQAVLTVIRRRKWAGKEPGRLNLSETGLRGANLTAADLTRATLAGATLAGATLAGADLAGADLTGANLTGANLTTADLRGAWVGWTDLTRANLIG